MNDVLGILDLYESDTATKIRNLTLHRPTATLPFAGRYRLMDFSLSCMVNSGIGRIGMLLPNKARSILDHVRSGKDWDLARRHDGLFYLPVINDRTEAREGNLPSLYQHMTFLEDSDSEYVLMCGTKFLFNIDFTTALRFHENTKADITLMYHNVDAASSDPTLIVNTEENGLVSELATRHQVEAGDKEYIGVCIMSRKRFIQIVKSAYERGGADFLLDGILRQQDNLTIYACEHTGYVCNINSTIKYYAANMDLAKPEIWGEIFCIDNPVYTRIRDEAPAQYKKTAKAHNSLIANGCEIEGTVENSIIFRGVKVGKGVVVKDSIIMQGCNLQEGVTLENVICDRNVQISEGKWLKGSENYPLIVEKNVVI